VSASRSSGPIVSASGITASAERSNGTRTVVRLAGPQQGDVAGEGDGVRGALALGSSQRGRPCVAEVEPAHADDRRADELGQRSGQSGFARTGRARDPEDRAPSWTAQAWVPMAGCLRIKPEYVSIAASI
jgi:hypothetical protein